MDQPPLLEYLLYAGHLLHGGKCASSDKANLILTDSQIAFIIPLGAKPNQCHNAITPNDMYSDLSCFIRTLAFHLQVCWEIVLGPKFKWGAFVCGFGIPAIGLTVMLILTGVSFRFGAICHINIAHGWQDYWAPITAFATAALVLQLATVMYCTHIYLRSLFDKSVSTVGGSGPSYSSSVRSATARQAYRRVRRVVQLQWRGMALVLIIIANVIFFAVVFIHMDRQVEPTAANLKKATPWLMCLTMRSKEECTKYASGLGPNEATILAVVYLLSLVGLWNFLLFARPSMFAGWLDLYRRGLARRHEFISADASDRHPDHKGFEMLTTAVNTPDDYMRSPSPAQMMGRNPVASPSPTFDRSVHFGQEARYHRPSMSFSGPRPPARPKGAASGTRPRHLPRPCAIAVETRGR
ncbi:hypothetical protein N7492_000762 [Penicillium capsulatum]|uniref:G-protein coupled receptors family 2 profile 2 domain-containing protein n=1 Tax=Penicillium capsulatum TaxID=69766 RepID=A0A9W9LYU2_9EURO|nr:hypothetical protein N7492_000762 [Penicillium capsulatum]